MADITGWLRSFQRVRAAHTMPECLNLSQEIKETTEEMRVAQFTSGKHFNPSLGRFTGPPLSGESPPHLNQVEQIWHNPDPDQMAETLKVAMMTRSSFDPLHVRFNSCILHVLEAYHQMRNELAEKDREIQDLKETYENDIRQLKQQEIRWKEREDNYNSELKRLEVMLATGARGLELVTLARSMSTLNRSGGALATKSNQINREKELENVASIEEPMMSDFAEKKDSFTSANYVLQRRALDTGHTFVSQWSNGSGEYRTLGQATLGAEYNQYENDKDFNTTRFKQVNPITCSDTGPVPYLGEPRSRLSRKGGSKDSHPDLVQRARYGGKSNPDTLAQFEQESIIKSSHTNGGKNKQFLRKKLTSDPATHHRGFSFVPGDDFGSLTSVNIIAHNSVKVLNSDGINEKRPCLLHSLNVNFNNEFPDRKIRQAWLVTEAENDRNEVRKKVADCFKIKPEYSSLQSSISVAGRDQYVEGSNGFERVYDTLRSPKANRLTGSNEATIAVVRAIAVSEKML